MKAMIKEYTFDPANRTITFTNPVTLESLLIITNVTTNTQIYSFVDPLRGGSVAGNVLTLVFDTTAMSATDVLQIFVEVDNTDFNALFLQVLNRMNTQIEEGNSATTELVRSINSFKRLCGFPDAFGRLRVAVEANANISTINTVTNLNTLSGHPASQLILGTINMPAKSLRNKIDIT